MKIVLASSNKGKIQEINNVFSEKTIEIIPQTDLGIPEPTEDRLTFIENALLKARHACALSNLPAIADDSGLVVRALSGAPGIYSARYAGENIPFQQNIIKLLENLREVPTNDRQAFFYCSLVYLRSKDDPCPIICEGIWHGSILFEPRGIHGFGYDPVFLDEERNCSAAELSLDIKNEVSHRGQALKQLLSKLDKI